VAATSPVRASAGVSRGITRQKEETIVRMRVVMRRAGLPLLLLAASVMTGCQSPSEEDPLDVDDFLETSANPSPTNAETSTGRTYRVVRGNNQPDEILEFDWKAGFGLSAKLNNNATSDDIDLQFPVQLTSATLKVQQASGGIVSPPTGGDVEHYDSVTSNVSGNEFNGVDQTLTMWFDVWYDLPSLKKEALITVTLTFADDDGQSFSKNVQVRVNP
jgi:hypothetical protein